MWITKRIPLSTSSTEGLVRRTISSKDKSISALAHCSRLIFLIFLQNLNGQITFEMLKRLWGLLSNTKQYFFSRTVNIKKMANLKINTKNMGNNTNTKPHSDPPNCEVKFLYRMGTNGHRGDSMIV